MVDWTFIDIVDRLEASFHENAALVIRSLRVSFVQTEEADVRSCTI